MQDILHECQTISDQELQRFRDTLAAPRSDIDLCLQRAQDCYEVSPMNRDTLMLLAVFYYGDCKATRLAFVDDPLYLTFVADASEEPWAAAIWAEFAAQNELQ